MNTNPGYLNEVDELLRYYETNQRMIDICPGYVNENSFQSFSNHEELMKEMVNRLPHKIDIGAVYNARPSDHRKITNFQPQEKELVKLFGQFMQFC